MRSTFKKHMILVLISIGFLFTGLKAEAIAVVINVPIPTPVEVVPPPHGYATCYLAPSGFYHGYYVHAHQVCEYADSPMGGAWISGYWQCPGYVNGTCGGPWVWSPRHWVQRGNVEYGVRWHEAYYRHGPQHYGPHYAPQYAHGYHENGYNHIGYHEGNRGHEGQYR